MLYEVHLYSGKCTRLQYNMLHYEQEQIRHTHSAENAITHTCQCTQQEHMRPTLSPDEHYHTQVPMHMRPTLSPDEHYHTQVPMHPTGAHETHTIS